MDIAIQMQPIYLGEERVLFRTVGLLKGKYDEEKDIFTDEYGYEYNLMNGTSLHADRYFCCAAPLDRLKEAYEGLSEVEMLTDLLYNFMNRFYIGEFNVMSGTIDLIEYNWDQIEEDLVNIKQQSENQEYSSNEEIVEFDPNDNEKFTFDLKSLKTLRDMQTVEEIRDFLDKLIDAGEYIKEINSKKISENVSLKPKENKKYKLDRKASIRFNLKDMRDFVLSEIVAQDEAVKRITTCIMSNFDSTNPKRKSHLLLTGPTGTGKSKTIQLICEYLDIPYAKVDSTDYTQAGYIGRSVDEMLQRLIYAANGDIEKAQKGILVVDEIDKKASKNDYGNVATKAVMDSLLKITGRGIVQVDIAEGKTKTTIDFDTSDLTVIFTGAFEGIDDLENNKTVGFIKDEKTLKQENQNMPKLLIKYGMTPELIGRIKCIVPLKKFDENDYVKILKYSKSSPLLIEKDYYENDKGIKFIYTSSCIKELAKQAKELNVGARGLESAVSKMLEDVQDRVLNGEPIKQLKLTKKTAMDNKEYYVEY